MSIMCIKYYFHFHLSVPLLHATSDYIKSNFFGFRWAKWVVFSLVMQLNMLTDRDNSLSWDFAMCWWNSVVQSTKRFNSVVFLQRLKASYSIHLSQHLSWFLFSSWYTICDEQMVLFVSCNFLVIVRRDQFDVSREYVKLTSHILPNVLRRDYCRLEMLDSMGCVPLGWSGSGSAIRDHLDHGRSNEPTNPCPEWIHRFIWSTTIRVISDHWSWNGSSQRNAPMCFITIANGRFAVKHTCITVISTDLENKRRSQTIRECSYF